MTKVARPRNMMVGEAPLRINPTPKTAMKTATIFDSVKQGADAKGEQPGDFTDGLDDADVGRRRGEDFDREVVEHHPPGIESDPDGDGREGHGCEGDAFNAQSHGRR